jgi:hypothetical protein
MLRDLFALFDKSVARHIRSSLIIFLIYTTALTTLVFFSFYSNVFDLLLPNSIISAIRGSNSPAQLFATALMFSIFVLVFSGGAIGLLKDSAYSAPDKVSASETAELRKIRAELDQLQGSSFKLQASSFKLQASSFKLQASSFKLQAHLINSKPGCSKPPRRSLEELKRGNKKR